MDARREIERERFLRPEADAAEIVHDFEILPWSYERDDGWDRVSLQFASFRPAVPALSADDLLLPNGLGSWRMLIQCLAMAVMMTVLYIWVPELLINVFLPVPRPVYAGLLGGGVVVLTVLLYVAGTRETRRDRAYAARL